MAEPFFVAPQSIPAPLNVIGESVTVLAAGERTGSYEIFIQSGPEGVGPPPHTHPWDEAYFVLEGMLEVSANGVAQVLGPGGFVHVPAGCVHAYASKGGPARFLSVTSKPGAARFFGEMNRDVATLPPDIPTVLSVAARNHVSIAAPPP